MKYFSLFIFLIPVTTMCMQKNKLYKEDYAYLVAPYMLEGYRENNNYIIATQSEWFLLRPDVDKEVDQIVQKSFQLCFDLVDDNEDGKPDFFFNTITATQFKEKPHYCLIKMCQEKTAISSCILQTLLTKLTVDWLAAYFQGNLEIKKTVKVKYEKSTANLTLDYVKTTYKNIALGKKAHSLQLFSNIIQ